jgi:hypothetical protein
VISEASMNYLKFICAIGADTQCRNEAPANIIICASVAMKMWKDAQRYT